MPETTTVSLEESIAAIGVLRAAFLDRPLLGDDSFSHAAEEKLIAILDDTARDLRVRALAASALLEPSWLRGANVVISRQMKARARAVLREAVPATG